MRYRIRRKGEKFVLQRAENGSERWESRTLNPSLELWEAVCPDTIRANMSQIKGKVMVEVDENFGQSLLTEPKKEDTLPSKEDILKSLKEMGI